MNCCETVKLWPSEVRKSFMLEFVASCISIFAQGSDVHIQTLDHTNVMTSVAPFDLILKLSSFEFIHMYHFSVREFLSSRNHVQSFVELLLANLISEVQAELLFWISKGYQGDVVPIQTFQAVYQILDPLEVHREPDEARVLTLVLRSAILSVIWFQIVLVRGSHVFTGESALYAEYHIDNTHKVEKNIIAEYIGFLWLVCIDEDKI